MTNNQNQNQNQTIRLIDFHNRYVDLKMKGTWGYVNPELKAKGFAMMTAESYIEEFEVKTTKVFDDEGKNLKSPLLIGTDKYGRELEVPTDRILAVGWLDTQEQARLKALTWLQEGYSDLPIEALEGNELLQKMVTDNQKMYDELIAQGVTLYQRRG